MCAPGVTYSQSLGETRCKKTRNRRRRGYGLRLLPPQLRLAVVVLSTSAFAFVHTVPLAVIVFTVSMFFLFLGPRIRHPKILFTLLIANTIFMLAGNVVFSPVSGSGHTFYIFRFNMEGVRAGVVGALKRNAMILLSFAWLSASQSPEEICASFSFVRSRAWHKYFLVFLKGIQNLTIELKDHYYSLLIRGVMLTTVNPRKRLLQMYLILNAVINRFFRNVSRMTFSGENHFIEKGEELIASISVHELRTRYVTSMPEVLHGIDIEFAAGDVVCLLGRSESGKTTLLRCLSGYIPRVAGEIISGSITINGRKVEDGISLAEIARLIRYVGSNSKDYFLGLTVGQEMMAVVQCKEIALQCLETMGIAELWDMETTALSGGQQARLLLAAALVSHARCLLFDAPLAQLDNDGRQAFIAALERMVRQRNLVIVLADESADWYVRVANRYVLLEDGCVKKDIRAQFSTAEDVHYGVGYGRCFTVPKRNLSSAAGKIIVKLRGVDLWVDDHMILRNVYLELRNDECLVILGANGSGKTMTMLTLAGVFKPMRGERCASGVHFGFVFQNPEDQLLESTCGAELSVGPRIRDWQEDTTQQFVSDGLRLLGLPAEYPTLELHPVRARMLACLSAMADADIVIFDEPTVEMDAIGIGWFADVVHGLLQRGVGVVIVTHDERVMPLASRVLVMAEGTIAIEERDIYVAIRRYKELSAASQSGTVIPFGVFAS